MTAPHSLAVSRSRDTGLLQYALDLAERGWHVFPCVPGAKRPALHGSWKELATTSPDRIRVWWRRAPYNIGVACGPSGLVVIDLDAGRRPLTGAAAQPSGATSLTALCQQHGQPCPVPTYTVRTPAGLHLYYAAPGERIKNSAGKLGPRIDVRSDGGYVIGAGSRSRVRPYQALDQRPPVPLPEWLAALLRAAPAAPSPDLARPVPGSARGTMYAMAALHEETRLVATALPGNRNDTLNRAAFNLGQLAAAGLLPHLAVISALSDAAWQSGLGSSEIKRTIRSGMTAGARNPRRTGR